MTLADDGQYQCYEAASPTAVSSITLKVLQQLRWPSYTPRYFVQVGSSTAAINASSSVGPDAITFAWTVGGTSVSTGSTPLLIGTRCSSLSSLVVREISL